MTERCRGRCAGEQTRILRRPGHSGGAPRKGWGPQRGRLLEVPQLLPRRARPAPHPDKYSVPFVRDPVSSHNTLLEVPRPLPRLCAAGPSPR
eukprot:5155601-Pyramimonas_sp.AAC.1